ncbi:MAG: delta-60 repeat domain-containing protein [Xanthomonadales bacterium]|nr:delta-60 repeat domain-containing protein [Xanthomonadales bacterium]
MHRRRHSVGLQLWLASLFLMLCSAVQAQNGFDPNANDLVWPVASQADGKLLVGGGFTQIDGQTVARIVRLNTDGSLDTSFNASVTGSQYATWVTSIAVQGDGKVLIGGTFTQTNGQAQANLARLNTDGSFDSSFTPDVNDAVFGMSFQADGKILAAGRFYLVDGTAHSGVVRLNAADGSVDASFADPALTGGASPGAQTVAVQTDGKVVVGGGFLQIHGQSQPYLARLNMDGSLDNTFSPSLAFPELSVVVNKVLVQADGRILAGGKFSMVNGQSQRNLVRLNANGSIDGGFDVDTDWVISTMALQPDGQILLGGDFLFVGGKSRNRVARLGTDGSVDPYFDPDANAQVFGLVVQADGKVVIGGDFTVAGHRTRNRIARFNSDGTLDSFTFGSNAETLALAVQADGATVVGGDFTEVLGEPRDFIARINPDFSLDATFDPVANGEVRSLVVQDDGKLLVGGDFTEIAGQVRQHLARLNPDGSLDLAFDPAPNQAVNSIVVQTDGKLLIGGAFTEITGQPQQYLARLNADGSLDGAFVPTVDNEVLSVAVQTDDRILLGGWFSSVESQNRSHLARLHPDGSLDSSFDPGADDWIGSLVLQPDGKLLLAGGFMSVDGQVRHRIARLNRDGSLDAGFDPDADAAIDSLLMQPDGRILLGGAFSSIAGQPRHHIARLRLDGSLDGGFDPEADGIVGALAVRDDGKVVAGGQFARIGGRLRDRLALLNPQGRLDEFVNAGHYQGESYYVQSLTSRPDGKVLVGGQFPVLADSPRRKLALLDETGRIDSGFVADGNPPFEGFPRVLAIIPLPDGRWIVGGSFTEINGQALSYLARLNADGSPDLSFVANADGPVEKVLPWSDGKLMVSGGFSQIGGATRHRLALLNADGSADTSFDPGVAFSGAGNTVDAMAKAPDGKLLASGYGAILRLNPDGSTDTTLSLSGVLGANSRVYGMAQQADGKLVVGGDFGQANSQFLNLARLNTNGSVDASFNAGGSGDGADDWVTSVSLDAEGRAMVAGRFNTIRGQPRADIARFNTDGSLDADFDFTTDLDTSAMVHLSQQADGKVLVSGNFTRINDRTQQMLARLDTPDAALQTLDATLDGSIHWQRGGSAPRLFEVWFEQSSDGQTWTSLGPGERVADGWQLTGQSLPRNQNLWLRARGYSIGTGYLSGTAALIESVRLTYLDASLFADGFE